MIGNWSKTSLTGCKRVGFGHHHVPFALAATAKDDRREPMRQGQQNRRGRGRSNTNTSSNSSSSSSSNNNHNQNGGRKQQNPLARNYESNGPDVKIRGSAAQIAEKYMTLARDASSAGDIVMSENYLQHAEHYNRIIMAAQTQIQTQPQQQPQPQLQQQQPSIAHQGHDNPNSMNAPQRFHSESNGALRDQPQPQPQPQIQPAVQPPAIPSEQPIIEHVVAEQDAAALVPAPQEADAGQANRRRRRRYPGSGSARAGTDATDGGTAAASGASEVRPAGEVLA